MKKYKRKPIKKYDEIVINKRIIMLKKVSIIIFLVIIVRLAFLNMNMGNYYKMILDKKTDNTIYGESAPRGRIYDRNNKLLVDNIAIKKIYYIKSKGITVDEEIYMAYQLIKVLNLDYDNLLERNLKEFYLIINEEVGNEKITNEELELFEKRKLNSNDIYELKIDRITKEELDTLTSDDRKCAYLFYLMNKGYYNEEKTIKIDNVTDYEYAYISENVNIFKGFNTKLDWNRIYLYGDVMRSILGSVSSSNSGIPKEKKDYYLSLGYDLDDRVGISGIEEQYESVLKGKKATYKVNDDNTLELISEAKKGNDIVLSIDIDLQKNIEKIVDEELVKTKKEPNTKFYNRSFVIIQNPNTGEIYAIVGRQILKNNHNKYETNDYSVGAITSTVTPGSVVKGASILVGYNTKVIDIGTTMLDKCIGFANMPEKCSWKNLGYVNDLDALKWSSNVYQFKIAMMVGGFDYSKNKVLDLDLKAFDIYRTTFYQFGLGVTTGIDFPIEEDGYGGNSNNSDLLINYAIGQYDTYTPLQLSQYISTIANGGKRIKTKFLKSVINNEEVLYTTPVIILNEVETEEKYINRIKQGFRLCMMSGTCVGYMGKAPSPAGKTGTSESFVDASNGIYNHPTISNNFVGYAPSNNPIMSIIVSSPDVQDLLSGSYKTNVNNRIATKSSNAFFDLYNKFGERIY